MTDLLTKLETVREAQRHIERACQLLDRLQDEIEDACSILGLYIERLESTEQ